MRMKALLEEAARQEAADLAEAEAGYAAARKAQAEELAARQAAFIEWLGDLADDLTIQPPVLRGDKVLWQIRPRSWRIPINISVTIYRGDTRAYTFGRDQYVCYESPTEPGLLQFFLEQERAYQKELATRIERLTHELSTSHSEEMLAHSHDQLVELAPERAAEWDALYAAGTEALRGWR